MRSGSVPGMYSHILGPGSGCKGSRYTKVPVTPIVFPGRIRLGEGKLLDFEWLYSNQTKLTEEIVLRL